MANAPVVSPVLSVSPPPCKDERFSVGMEEWTDSALKSPPSRSPTRPVTRKRQRYSKGEQVWEEPLPDEASIGASSRRRVFLGFGISLVLPALSKRGGCSLTTARPKR